MKYNTQNNKIATINEKTLVVGIDIGSQTHYARAFDYRKFEYSKKAFKFSNTEEGFKEFKTWMSDIAEKYGKTEIAAGMEPTGHYWFNLGEFLQANGIKLVHVNPHHVKKSKELDDNNPSKSDSKDPKVIAGLITEGRFQYPYIPAGVYAEIRSLSNLRFQIQEELTRIRNRLAKWFSIYFPEYKDIYRNVDAKSGMMILKEAPLPADILKLGEDGINKIWRNAKLRGVGLKRAKTLIAAAEHSIGSTNASTAARIELNILLKDLEEYSNRLNAIMAEIEEKLKEVPYAENLLKIKGIGLISVIGFIAEVGDISRFNDPKQLQKLAGLSIVKNSSGKHKGESRISRRGRKRLRYSLYEAAISVIAYNPEFKEIHCYYTTRTQNPLKKMQSVIAIACKLIRVFYAILKKGVEYDGEKMLRDIKREQLQAA